MKRFAFKALAAGSLWLALAATSAWAQELPTPTWLPSTAQASAWIEAEAAVMRARHAAQAAEHGAAAIAASPNEWALRLQGQRRSFQDGGAGSGEWLAHLERPIRVNGKAGLDEQLRELEIEIGRARVGEARHEAARALSELWTQVIVAQRQQLLAREQVALTQGNLDAVTRRQRAGDASALDVNLAQAEIGETRRAASQAATGLAKLRAALRLRFGAEAPDDAVLPEPQPPVWPEPRWTERVLAEADPLAMAQGEWRRAGVAAARARADRVPDPVVGVFTASEARRNERIVGLSISIPLSGSYRSQRALQAAKEADVLQAAWDQARREVELEAVQTYAEAQGSLDRWRIARETARLSTENARLTQRAYGLGEADLQALLLARRQASDAARSALDAQGEALRWEMRLLIDAHLIWNLAQD